MATKTSKRSKRRKKPKTYYCEICDYTASQKFNWDRHVETVKHQLKMETGVAILETKRRISSKNGGYECCYCGKIYKSKGGVYKHVKKCASYCKKIALFEETFTPFEKEEKEEKIDKDDIVEMPTVATELLKQQNEAMMKKDEAMKQQNEAMMKKDEIILEMIKNGGMGGHNNSTNNSSTNNSHNNSHNTNNISINVFLNEHCKDAKSLQDFVNEITFKLTDVLSADGQLPIENPVTVKLVEKLTDLPVTERPIHCTDQKRGKFMVKEEEGWTEDVGGTKIKASVKRVQSKAFVDAFQAFDAEYKPPHPGKVQDKKDSIVNPIRNNVTQKGTNKIIMEVASVTNIKEAIKSIQDQDKK
ncbi:MAG: hypothetical protein CXT73_05680 [Methanobacteriota archaeon]|nr:MAG: hypothetical protein CXT73_05680 [Euryarchaeota archaeon]